VNQQDYDVLYAALIKNNMNEKSAMGLISYCIEIIIGDELSLMDFSIQYL